jgi:hypothetical protein
MTTETSVAAAEDGWRARVRRVAPWALGLLSTGLVAGGFSLGLHLANLHNGLIAATFTAVGGFVVMRRPDNRAGFSSPPGSPMR